MVTAALFISLAIFLILNVPVGVAIGCASFVAVIAVGSLGSIFIASTLVTASDSSPLMAIPLFILAGELMGSGGVSKRLLNVCSAFFGRISGGLAICTVVVCMFFAAVSGSGPATVAAVGSMVVPAMLENGYSKRFTLALIACAGSIGVIIPPSIPMVVYGVATNTSISSLFMGGFGPGFLIGGSLIVFCYLYSRKMGWKGGSTACSFKEKMRICWDAKWALVNPIIILGGIYAGIFTPTEAASVAAVYAFVCGVFIYKELNVKRLWTTVASAFSTNGTTMIIIGCATAFAKILTMEQIPLQISNIILSVSGNAVIILVVINLFLLLVGCIMDTTPAMMVLSPILLPIAVSLGLSPVHFGLIMVVNLAIGFCTPPLGINLFVAARVGNEPLDMVIRGIVPFILVMVMDLLIITFVPAVSMWLPNLLTG